MGALMMERIGARGVALVVALTAWLTTSAAFATPLPSGRDALAPTVQVGREDQQTLGPAGLTVDGKGVFVADPLASRAIEYDRSLRPLRAWPFAIAPQDLMRRANGQLCAIDAAAERLECRGSAMAAGPALARRLRGGTVALVHGPADAIWALRGDGFAGPAWGTEALVHAMPLGIGAAWQAAGLWRGPARVEVLLWPWAARPDDKGVEPSRSLAMQAPPGLRAGSVRPLRMDAQGRVYVAVEWLGGERRLEVTEEVVRIDAADRRAAIRWRAATYAPGLQDLEVDAAGVVWRLYHSPGRVHVDAFPADAWREVTR
jgi:hypothetical protein